MAATPVVLLITLSTDNSPPHQPSLFHITMLSYFTFFIFLTLFILVFTLYTILKNNNDCNRSNGGEKEEDPRKTQSFPLNDNEMIAQQQNQDKGCEPGPENLTQSLLLEILPSSSPKWDALFSKSEEFDDDPGEKIGSGQEEKKRKKKRAKKKRSGPNEEERKEKEELVCLYPFTKSSSATQRKIKQQYDQLVKSHGSNGLTLDQVGQFVNCLVEARNELQNKSEVIKRRFTITKALLFKADRSSFDRLRQQIYKLELEQKRLEEDAFVYNWLQEQLKVSPAYKKMLEIGACMEMKAKKSFAESTDAEFADISFEELLAQEKKDAFWQRNGKLKPCSG
ncbi:hypothetical protein PHJA_001078200 [Phtheirospermum japonicum]|uniref:CA-responsive protein n=1 Tax=Phtheirospermum japonicum TaxID=374723 RepID=A0A830C1Q9_9LAMI|nr:hypothetical protein PHJA_001078200 [Phtheirospermum japonicum]